VRFLYYLKNLPTWREKTWSVKLAARIYFPDPVYLTRLRVQKALSGHPRCDTPPLSHRYLFAAPVGAQDKVCLEKVIRRFGHEDFDYLLFAYDDTPFSGSIYRDCVFLREEKPKWYCGRAYLTPERCAGYEYIFFWDGDIDVGDFSYRDFIDIMRRNNLELAQPSLAPGSYVNHRFTRKDESCRFGRYFDFVEIMAPVFTYEAWVRFWDMLDPEGNYWGYGYDDLARSFCRYRNMGIIDAQSVVHSRPPRADAQLVRLREMQLFLKKHPGCRVAKRVSYGRLR